MGFWMVYGKKTNIELVYFVFCWVNMKQPKTSLGEAPRTVAP